MSHLDAPTYKVWCSTPQHTTNIWQAKILVEFALFVRIAFGAMHFALARFTVQIVLRPCMWGAKGSHCAFLIKG